MSESDGGAEPRTVDWRIPTKEPGDPDPLGEWVAASTCSRCDDDGIRFDAVYGWVEGRCHREAPLGLLSIQDLAVLDEPAYVALLRVPALTLPVTGTEPSTRPDSPRAPSAHLLPCIPAQECLAA